MTEQEAIINYMTRNELMSFAPTAALIDMDGTLYDSMGHHADAWHRMMSEIGIDCDRDEFFMYEGRTGVDTINLLFRRAYGHDASPEEAKELYRRKTVLFSEMPPVAPMKGAGRMVKSLLDRHIATVLVTGSGQNTLISRLDTDFPGAFPSGMRVTGHDVFRQGSRAISHGLLPVSQNGFQQAQRTLHSRPGVRIFGYGLFHVGKDGSGELDGCLLQPLDAVIKSFDVRHRLNQAFLAVT